MSFNIIFQQVTKQNKLSMNIRTMQVDVTATIESTAISKQINIPKESIFTIDGSQPKHANRKKPKI